MICKIAELLVEIPEEGGIAPLLEEYKTDERAADITIDPSYYRYERYAGLSDANVSYVESGSQFHYWLLHFGGMMLHASAVELGGKAYLFSGPCGMGKSTHTRLWQREFPGARIFNDDKPALRRQEGKWFAYGTPWCGKDGINRNRRLPLAGICFLEQGKENRICELSKQEAFSRVVVQTIHKFKKEDKARLMFAHVNRLLSDIPMFCLVNRPEAEAAVLNYTTMLQAAEKRGL
jgi:hypothetical protein